MRPGNRTTVYVKEVPPPIRPRATTALQRFGNAFSAKINEELNAERKRIGASTTDNLQIYSRIRGEMYNNADEETQAKYGEEAKAFNMKVHGPPDESEIYA
jgi:hypothetical protein